MADRTENTTGKGGRPSGVARTQNRCLRLVLGGKGLRQWWGVAYGRRTHLYAGAAGGAQVRSLRWLPAEKEGGRVEARTGLRQQAVESWPDSPSSPQHLLSGGAGGPVTGKGHWERGLGAQLGTIEGR